MTDESPAARRALLEKCAKTSLNSKLIARYVLAARMRVSARLFDDTSHMWTCDHVAAHNCAATRTFLHP